MSRLVTTRSVRKAVDEGDLAAVRAVLTMRQLRFCDEYLIDMNATAAARRAGYSPNGIDKAAAALMRHEGVRYVIEEQTKSKEAKIMSVDPDYVLSRIVQIVNEEGARNGDKLRGLELLARHLGMLTDKQEITGKDGGSLVVEQRTQEDAKNFVDILRSLVKKSSTEPTIFHLTDDGDSNVRSE